MLFVIFHTDSHSRVRISNAFELKEVALFSEKHMNRLPGFQRASQKTADAMQSLAVDSNGDALQNDQRGPGFARIRSGTVDIGAFEFPNSPPTADIGGPYVVNEGSSVWLDGSFSFDPDEAVTTLNFEWDLDNDGQFDDAVGRHQSLSWTSLELLGIDDDGSFPIKLQVTDSENASDTASTVIIVKNVAPTSSIDSIRPIRLEGTSIDFIGSATDPASANDVLTFEWNFGDGSPMLAGANASHTYADNGTFVVSLTVRDEDGGSDTVTQSITVEKVAPTASIDSISPIR